MYESREGDFRYVIERRTDATGASRWHWSVIRDTQLIEAGVSERSHAHAETEALAIVFREGSAPLSRDAAFGRLAIAAE